MSSKLSGKEIEKIIDTYFDTDSIIETAKVCQVSTVKVRKILITAELWRSDTSDVVASLLEQGMTTTEIAETLCMSVKNVQAYMPYERGAYGGDKRSLDAMRASKYRERMRNAVANQVVKASRNSERRLEMTDNKTVKEPLDVIKLHLEIRLDRNFHKEIETLKKYGDMKEGISRDILVPSDITLHALNYAILRAFGWQNGHLHNFNLPEDVMSGLTENKFVTWAALAGVYFRYPSENFQDIYWDDDYKEGQSIRSWMKKKYTGPYKYKGEGEHYLFCQEAIEDFFLRRPELEVRKYVFGADIQPAPYKVASMDATLEEVRSAFWDFNCHELLERLTLKEVLLVTGAERLGFDAVRDYIFEEVSDIDIDDAIDEYENTRFGSFKKEYEFLDSYNTKALPITYVLNYEYDYGDGWEVTITSEAVYHKSVSGEWVDHNGDSAYLLDGELDEVVEKHRPICIAKDGIELVDDVGGIRGFCDLLNILNCDPGDDPELIEEQENMKSWASFMGWTGRKISPKQTL